MYSLKPPAAFKGQLEAAKLLLAKGADIDARDNEQMTPLHVVAMEGRKEMSKLLVSKGAQINPKDAKGRTPLYLATHYDSKDNKGVAEILRANGGYEASNR